MQEKEISQAVIRRMPRYYRYLGELLDAGVERISSNDLSLRMNVTASQIRQDLNNFGGFGQQGYGYNVKYLYEEIGKIRGLNQQHNIIVIGAGNLGQALANYVKFEKLGFMIIGLFDVNPALDGVTVRGIKIRMLDELEDFCRENKVDIAALTMPKEKADAIANRLVGLGIHAIWNFAHVDLELIDKDVVVENVHLSDSDGSRICRCRSGNTAEEIGCNDIYHCHSSGHPAYAGIRECDQLIRYTSGAHQHAHRNKERHSHQTKGTDSLYHLLTDRCQRKSLR